MITLTSRSRTASLLGSAWLACLLAFGTVVHAKKAAAAPLDAGLVGEVLVQLHSTAALGPLLVKHRLSLVSQFGSRPIYRLKVVGAADVNATIDALVLEPGVLNAEPNFVHQSPEARRVSSWAIGTPAAYTAQWAPQAMRLPEAHLISTGVGVRVAVLDTGVDTQHPALAGRLMAGFDFVDLDNDPNEVGDVATSSSFGHGTHVAGLVALTAPGATIMPLRVLDAQGVGNAWVLAEALLYAVDPDRNPATNDGAHVINLSLGSTSRTRILDTVGRLATCAIEPVVLLPTDELADPGYNGDRDRCSISRGAVVVVAAGNDASSKVRQYPAAEGVYGLIAVAASNESHGVADFSNFGNWIGIAAPGEGVTSTVPGGTVPGGGWGTWSGTSMAAPLAAGTAALLREQQPALSPRDITRLITRTGAPLCGSKLSQVDAVAALTQTAANALPCP